MRKLRPALRLPPYYMKIENALAFPTALDGIGDLLERLDSGRRLSPAMYRLPGWMSDAHFGRFAGNGTEVSWVVLGLAPVFLFATGAFVWWTRVRTNSHDR